VCLLLSTIFPLSEKSAVNQKGDFNVGNVTVYEEMANDGMMDVDGQEEEKGIPINY
jgi:hypothetical protein